MSSSAKDIMEATVGGVAGGKKFVSNGMFFKFARYVSKLRWHTSPSLPPKSPRCSFFFCLPPSLSTNITYLIIVISLLRSFPNARIQLIWFFPSSATSMVSTMEMMAQPKLLVMSSKAFKR